GEGGATGLTGNPQTFRRWMIGGPQIATLVNEFEEGADLNAEEQLQHHEEVPSFQSKFRAHVQSMVDTITELGNPLSDENKELVSLGCNIVADVSMVKTVGAVKLAGLLQYQSFYIEKHGEARTGEPDVSTVVIDVVAVVQMLKPGTTKTFKEYSKAVFGPYIARVVRNYQLERDEAQEPDAVLYHEIGLGF
ncbi:hypothetical protein Hamer_G007916, partial [Homarus americanus]